MIFTCRECDRPMMLTKVIIKQTIIQCPYCTSRYRIDVEQVTWPTTEVRAKIAQEQASRITVTKNETLQPSAKGALKA